MECTKIIVDQEEKNVDPVLQSYYLEIFSQALGCNTQFYDLTLGSNVVGRDESNANVVLKDSTVSRSHAEILLDIEGFLTIRDLNSSNKTSKNNVLLNPNVFYSLRGDEVLQFGEVHAIIHSEHPLCTWNSNKSEGSSMDISWAVHHSTTKSHEDSSSIDTFLELDENESVTAKSPKVAREESVNTSSTLESLTNSDIIKSLFKDNASHIDGILNDVDSIKAAMYNYYSEGFHPPSILNNKPFNRHSYSDFENAFKYSNVSSFEGERISEQDSNLQALKYSPSYSIKRFLGIFNYSEIVFKDQTKDSHKNICSYDSLNVSEIHNNESNEEDQASVPYYSWPRFAVLPTDLSPTKIQSPEESEEKTDEETKTNDPFDVLNKLNRLNNYMSSDANALHFSRDSFKDRMNRAYKNNASCAPGSESEYVHSDIPERTLSSNEKKSINQATPNSINTLDYEFSLPTSNGDEPDPCLCISKGVEKVNECPPAITSVKYNEETGQIEENQGFLDTTIEEDSSKSISPIQNDSSFRKLVVGLEAYIRSPGTDIALNQRVENDDSEVNEMLEYIRTKNILLNSLHKAEVIKKLLMNTLNAQSSKKETYTKKSFLPKVMFSGYEDTQFDEKLVLGLGGTLTEELYECDLLVMNKFIVTFKVIAMLGRGVPIVNQNYVYLSKKENKFLDPWSHLIQCSFLEEKYSFVLRSTLLQSVEKKLLAEFAVFATKSVKPADIQLQGMVESSGGTYLHKIGKLEGKETIVISCVEDKEMYCGFLDNGFKVVSSECILMGILKHNLDFDKYALTNDS